jgi:hypothetical protein
MWDVLGDTVLFAFAPFPWCSAEVDPGEIMTVPTGEEGDGREAG